MAIRRVVTGLGEDGRSCVVDDGPVTTAYELPSRGGLSMAALLEVPMPPSTPADTREAAMPLSLVPGPGVARVIRAVHPPDAVAAAAAAEAAAAGGTDPVVPGRSELFDDSRGAHMHATPTVDVIVVASGAIDLVLEAGRVALAEGDVVVQQGTWHAWENPYDEPCVLVGVNFPVTPAH